MPRGLTPRDFKRGGEKRKTTYMLVDTPVQPSPAVRGRVLGVGHVGAGVKAPRRVLLRPELVAGAKDWPDGVGTVGVSGVVLLYLKTRKKASVRGVFGPRDIIPCKVIPRNFLSRLFGAHLLVDEQRIALRFLLSLSLSPPPLKNSPCKSSR